MYGSTIQTQYMYCTFGGSSPDMCMCEYLITARAAQGVGPADSSGAEGVSPEKVHALVDKTLVRAHSPATTHGRPGSWLFSGWGLVAWLVAHGLPRQMYSTYTVFVW